MQESPAISSSGGKKKTRLSAPYVRRYWWGILKDGKGKHWLKRLVAAWVLKRVRRRAAQEPFRPLTGYWD